jgi:hypothetical protein
MKLVFYPTYFRVKRLGPTRALVISTALVFMVTWLLHSYQWFWLRGGFPVTVQDTLFWGVLGAFVIAGALRELKANQKPKERRTGWNWRKGARAAITFAGFCFLWSLWSAESFALWLYSLGVASNVDLKGIVLIGVSFGTIFVLGGRDWTAAPTVRYPWLQAALQPSVRTGAVLLFLTVAGLSSGTAATAGPVGEWIATMQDPSLNARDTARQHRGYYEQLDVRATLNTAATATPKDLERWTLIRDLGVVSERPDFLDDLKPSWSGDYNGKRFSTNAWGMRDQAYDVQKAPGTLRIALLGPSHVMGDNVADDETFESIVERRLNEQFRLPGYQRFEILNFGQPAYSSLQQLAMLERALTFGPDVVVATHHGSNRELTERYLQRVMWKEELVPWEPVRQMLREVGLVGLHDGSVPVPFDWWRSMATRLGVDVRMPNAEILSRLRRMSNRSIEWSLQRFAERTREAGAIPAILAVNVVFDEAPREIPNMDTLRTLRLPIMNLFDVYPADRVLALRVAPWDDHPNAEAHRLIADRLYGELTTLIAALPARSNPLEAKSTSEGLR